MWAGDRRLRLALQLAQELVAFPRQLGTHPGGFVLTQLPLSDLVPMVAHRGGASYASVEEVWRRAEVPPAALKRLAEADAFRGMGLDRRRALWQVRALARAIGMAGSGAECSSFSGGEGGRRRAEAGALWSDATRPHGAKPVCSYVASYAGIWVTP